MVLLLDQEVQNVLESLSASHAINIYGTLDRLGDELFWLYMNISLAVIQYLDRIKPALRHRVLDFHPHRISSQIVPSTYPSIDFLTLLINLRTIHAPLSIMSHTQRNSRATKTGDYYREILHLGLCKVVEQIPTPQPATY